MGVAVQKAGVSENKNIQADTQFMTYDRSPAALQASIDGNFAIIVQRVNCTVVITKLL